MSPVRPSARRSPPASARLKAGAGRPPRSRGVIDRYRSFLPVDRTMEPVMLGEGSTPLVHTPTLAARIDPRISLYCKLEGLNPTGSFKDRGMTVAVTRAVADGRRAVLCASTGNTSASAAAYAARAGLTCWVLAPAGKVAVGKLSQAFGHGARVIEIDGNFDQALAIARELCSNRPIGLVNSVNPFRIDGQKTAAFEVVDDLGGAPDYHALPVGNAGNITAYWKGYREYHALGRIDRLPRMLGFQAAGAAPLVHGAPVERPETVASAIRIGKPASWAGAIAARDESGGRIDAVTDEEIMDAYAMLGRLEGLFVEPASAAPIAGLKRLAAKGFFSAPVTVVVTLTGTGLKDPDAALRGNAAAPDRVPASLEAIERIVDG